MTQIRSEQAPLTFSREEVQLIREYIKPAPFAGPAAPAVSVGDPVTSGTIPFPSPLTEKVPKLLGARFAIRNGAIIIVRKDSQQADAVLARAVRLSTRGDTRQLKQRVPRGLERLRKVDTGSREENASRQESAASVLVQSEPIMPQGYDQNGERRQPSGRQHS